MAENTDEVSQNKKIKNVTLWSCVQAICTVLFVFFILLKFYSSSFTVDFSTLLSIVLAVFSIWLSATFYFKATETSNRFYENTYSHSKDIATLLVKIESGFGEKLDNLRDNYSSIDSRMNGYIKNPIEKERESIESEMSEATEEIEKIKLSKDEIINGLILKANLAEKDKEEIKLKLQEKENNLKNANDKINSLESDLTRLDKNFKNSKYNQFDERSMRVERYLLSRIKREILKINNVKSLDELSYSQIQDSLLRVIKTEDLHSAFLMEAVQNKYLDLDNGLTSKGFSVLMSRG
ncbi:hypothetical protein [Providencia sp. wls1921]|uniref:hypothetical protein n=1 Tax=Providencia sp. wls1921 TaxID=2675153 RepID=UPI0012B63C64|nr:hypothetical protein [Providencia sp. wls1921]MTC43663.1 hypothetical protein [Providencia sp. wls1921]